MQSPPATFKSHRDFSCVAAKRLIVNLAWAASEGRIDPDSEAVKSILDQLTKPLEFDGIPKPCTHCQIPESPQQTFDRYRKDKNAWFGIAQYIYGTSLR